MGAYYFHQTPGCTDSTAINYNPEATSNDGSCYHDVLTDIDGNEYQAVQIGEQLWMKQNLKVTHYNNGDEIPTGYSNSEWADLDEMQTGAYAVYEDDPSNAETYGNMYNWYAVDDDRGVCPVGWHLPTYNEWVLLTDYLGGYEIAGGKMKSTDTLENGDGLWYSPNEGATNESSFVLSNSLFKEI